MAPLVIAGCLVRILILSLLLFSEGQTGGGEPLHLESQDPPDVKFTLPVASVKDEKDLQRVAAGFPRAKRNLRPQVQGTTGKPKGRTEAAPEPGGSPKI